MSSTIESSFGLARPEQIAGRSGRDILQAIAAGELPQPFMAQTLSFRLTEVGDGFVAFEAETGSHLLNPLGTVHGGWALTLIDSVTACAGFSLLAPGESFTTIETKGNFSRPIFPDTGLVRAEGTVISRGRQIISAEGRVLNAEGKVLAHGTSTLMVIAPSRQSGRG
ncbi:MAG: PaaI family thioesterase [Proteobacteria bacterium]|nr:PaaI family thioesterase [Pseudomonadota bacterium]